MQRGGQCRGHDFVGMTLFIRGCGKGLKVKEELWKDLLEVYDLNGESSLPFRLLNGAVRCL